MAGPVSATTVMSVAMSSVERGSLSKRVSNKRRGDFKRCCRLSQAARRKQKYIENIFKKTKQSADSD